MAVETSPTAEVGEIFTRRQAQNVVISGVWDSDGMDPVMDHIFDPGIIGVSRRPDNCLNLVRSPDEIRIEMSEAERIVDADSEIQAIIDRGYRGMVRDLFRDGGLELTSEELARCKEVINVGLMSDKIPDQTRRVLVLRYGLDGKPARTMKETGREVGNVTRERVRQIQDRGLGILRWRETSHRMISRRGTGTEGLLEEILGRSLERNWDKIRIRRTDNL